VLSIGLAAGVAAFLVSSGSPADAAMRLAGIALDPTLLLYATYAVVGLALGWIAVIVATHLALRQHAVLTKWQRVMGGVLVVALASAVAVPAAYASDIALIQRSLITSVFNGPDDTPAVAGERPQTQYSDPWANMPRVNVLLIGSDAGADREGVRPDTLILASIDTETGDTVMFSLPRNLQHVPFPLGTDGSQAWPDGFACANGSCMLNAIWHWAETNENGYYAGDPTPGLTATRDAVEAVLGLRVDTYAMVNLRGFAQVVDAIGGITMDVPRDLPIGGGRTLTGQQNPITGWIRAGEDVKLNGYQALWFARSRQGSDDYDRMRRQRCVLGAIIDQADPFTMVRAYPRLAAAAKDNMSTDIPQADLEAWVELSLRVKDTSVRSLPFTDDVIPDRGHPDYAAIQQLVQDSLEPPDPSSTTSTPSPLATPSQSAGATGATPSPTPSVRADQAQDLSTVC
jgi:LCP family protein required for cell wall assembly